MKKRKIAILTVALIMLAVGTFAGWLVYDAYRQDNSAVQPADLDAMANENADSAFTFLTKESPLPDNIRGYIIDPEKDFDSSAQDLSAAANAVFEKVDAILPNTVLIKYTDENVKYLVDAAKQNELDVIFYIGEDMLKAEKIQILQSTYGVDMFCVDENTEKAIKLRAELNLQGIYIGSAVSEKLTDKIKKSVENSELDFYFIKIESHATDNADEIIKNWAAVALTSKSKVYAILRNDNVTANDPTEILKLVKSTYNHGGFAGCIMADREKLSTDDNSTATKLYSYYEYFNNSEYTALTLNSFSVEKDYSAAIFSGMTSDTAYPVHIWCTAADSWNPAVLNQENGSFKVTIPLVYGENKIVIKHKSAMYTYYIDKVTDVMTSQNATVENGIISFCVTAVKGADVYASVANTYTVKLTEGQAVDSTYATYTGTYELSRDMSHLTADYISYGASYGGLTDIVMCNEEKQITPYDNHSLGNADFCAVTKDYAETTSTASLDDTSDPTCTPQLAGSYSYVSDYTVKDNNVICQTRLGMKIYMSNTRLILGGYVLPDNNINLDSVSVADGTTLTLTSNYPVFVKILQEPQQYYTGYLDRIYNVKEFSAEYIDIMFMDTKACSQSAQLDLTGSQIFSRYEWYSNADESFITLRLYLKNAGSFSGYSYSYDDNGKIVFEFRNNPTSLQGTVVMIDPGHGGYGSPGTNYNMEIYEKDVTFAVAQTVADILRENGATVIMTRSGDDAVFLSERVEIIREQKPDLYVSIHCDGTDSAAVYGTHTFYYKSYSMPLAEAIHNQLVKAYRSYYYTDSASDAYTGVDKGYKFFPYMVTRVEECPSVLVEMGYMSNEADARFLISEGGQNVLATAIAQGIADYIINY
ncbi:MAG: N-acetylmuramoyl-L-alanine amidase [Clostridia bacterium]|nr:N-acetylmuramoyl-L-alanine amidase [Clostridia bacterium]